MSDLLGERLAAMAMAAATKVTTRLPADRMRTRIRPTPNRLPYRAQETGMTQQSLLDDFHINEAFANPDFCPSAR